MILELLVLVLRDQPSEQAATYSATARSEASAPRAVLFLLGVRPGAGTARRAEVYLEGLLGALYRPLQEQFHILVTGTA